MRTTTKAAIAATVTIVLAAAGYHWATETEMTCTVTSKERVYGKDGQVQAYRLDTTCGILDIDEVPLAWAWDPTGLYESIDAGGTYDLTTTGVRIPELGWNPTVIGAEQAT